MDVKVNEECSVESGYVGRFGCRHRLWLIAMSITVFVVSTETATAAAAHWSTSNADWFSYTNAVSAGMRRWRRHSRADWKSILKRTGSSLERLKTRRAPAPRSWPLTRRRISKRATRRTATQFRR